MAGWKDDFEREYRETPLPPGAVERPLVAPGHSQELPLVQASLPQRGRLGTNPLSLRAEALRLGMNAPRGEARLDCHSDERVLLGTLSHQASSTRDVSPVTTIADTPDPPSR